MYLVGDAQTGVVRIYAETREEQRVIYDYVEGLGLDAEGPEALHGLARVLRAGGSSEERPPGCLPGRGGVLGLRRASPDLAFERTPATPVGDGWRCATCDPPPVPVGGRMTVLAFGKICTDIVGRNPPAAVVADVDERDGALQWGDDHELPLHVTHWQPLSGPPTACDAHPLPDDCMPTCRVDLPRAPML